MLLRALLLVAAFALAGCETPLLDSRSDLERTWDKALVVVPPVNGQTPPLTRLEAGSLARFTAAQPAGVRWPVVVYMHGCTGFGNLDFFQTLARAGYVVVAPDSFARRYRPLQCDPETRTGGYNLFVYDFRQAEISYAVQQLSALPWVDRTALVLMGASEGGVATALYRGDEFRARVIAQWTCTGRTNVRGLAGPDDSPVLAIVNASDPWYDPLRAPAQRGHCGDYMTGRLGSRSVVVPSSAHDIYADPANIRMMLDFLAQIRR